MADAGGMAMAAGGGGMSAKWPLRMALRCLSPAGTRARLSVVMFHRVRARSDPMFPAGMEATAFRARMQWLRDLFNVVPLEDAVERLFGGRLPERAAAITFDDGYADNASVALPILRELGLPATFFVASGFLDGGRMWNDTVTEAVRLAGGAELDASPIGLGRHPLGDLPARRAARIALVRALKYLPDAERAERVAGLASLAGASLPRDLMLSSAQVRELAAAGMGIGAHTQSHPILTRLSEAAAEREIAAGRDALEALVRQPVRLFAYPNGRPDEDYQRAHAAIAARIGFRAAFTTAAGAARASMARYELPRFTPWDRSPSQFGLRMLRNLRTPVRVASA